MRASPGRAPHAHACSEFLQSKNAPNPGGQLQPELYEKRCWRTYLLLPAPRNAALPGWNASRLRGTSHGKVPKPIQQLLARIPNKATNFSEGWALAQKAPAPQRRHAHSQHHGRSSLIHKLWQNSNLGLASRGAGISCGCHNLILSLNRLPQLPNLDCQGVDGLFQHS